MRDRAAIVFRQPANAGYERAAIGCEHRLSMDGTREFQLGERMCK